MTRFHKWSAAFAVLGVAYSVSLVRAEDKKEDKKPAEAKKDTPPPAGDKKPAADAKKDDKGGADAMMAMWAEMGAPGPEHKVLEKMAGNWEHTSKWRMGPAMPWQESKGTTMREVIYGGRFVRQETKGPAMTPGGAPFEGRAVNGYDKARKQYVNAWIDSESTSIMMSYGTIDASGKTITYTSEEPDFANPGKLKKTKTVYRFKDDKTHVFEMYDTGPDGKEFMNLEVTYTKK